MIGAPVSGTGANVRRAARFLALLAGVFAAAGCTTLPTAPGTVSKAVTKPCPASMPDKPAFPVDRLTGDEDDWTLITTHRAERATRRAYEIQLETRLRGCIEPDGAVR